MEQLLFETLDVYKIANSIGRTVRELVTTWNFFDKDTLGKQLVRSADSISLNICEGVWPLLLQGEKTLLLLCQRVIV